METLPQKNRVLIVDDDADMQIYLSTVLSGSGYEAVVAVDQKEGLEQAQVWKPRVIILDMMMAGEAGISFYRTLKNHHQLRSIPVIMMSAIDRKAFLHYRPLHPLRSGEELPIPEAFLSRPPEAEELVSVVRGFAR